MHVWFFVLEVFTLKRGENVGELDDNLEYESRDCRGWFVYEK